MHLIARKSNRYTRYDAIFASREIGVTEEMLHLRETDREDRQIFHVTSVFKLTWISRGFCTIAQSIQTNKRRHTDIKCDVLRLKPFLN